MTPRPVRALVLDAVRAQPGSTASDIAGATRLSIGVVLAQLVELGAARLVRYEVDTGPVVIRRRRYHPVVTS